MRSVEIYLDLFYLNIILLILSRWIAASSVAFDKTDTYPRIFFHPDKYLYYIACICCI